jgi:phenylalanyl-tRNA synthetase alpha chain
MDATALENEARAAVAASADLAELEDARVRFLGRKSPLKLALREVRDRETGMALNAARTAIEEALAGRERELAAATFADDDGFDPTLPGTPLSRGRLHLLTQIRREVEDVFLGLGYLVFDGPEVETVHNNFTALNTPEAHPSRAASDTFYVSDDVLLRTHTSPSQIRAMLEQEPPVYLIALGRVYRRDTPDATHSPVFHQVEALAVDRGITLADLRGTMEHFSSAIFGGRRKVRMRTSFFPFTEPSVEFDVDCPICDGAGCNVCKQSGWIELGGAGVVDPAVLSGVGYDPEVWSGFAFGLGLERIAMFRHGLPDLRLLWENDLRVLGQF